MAFFFLKISFYGNWPPAPKMYFGFILLFIVSHHMILLLLESPDIDLPNYKNLFSAYGQTCKLPLWIHETNLPVSRVSLLHVAYITVWRTHNSRDNRFRQDSCDRSSSDVDHIIHFGQCLKDAITLLSHDFAGLTKSGLKSGLNTGPKQHHPPVTHKVHYYEIEQ